MMDLTEQLSKLLTTPADEYHFFRRAWYSEHEQTAFISDIFSFINRPHHETVHVIFGIDDQTLEMPGVIADDSRRMDQESLYQRLTKILPISQSWLPEMTVTSVEVAGKILDVLTIFATPLVNRFKLALADVAGWQRLVLADNDGTGLVGYQYQQNPEMTFTLKALPLLTEQLPVSAYSLNQLQTPIQLGQIDLKYDSSLVKRLPSAYLDGGSICVAVPQKVTLNAYTEVTYYYLTDDSFATLVNRIIQQTPVNTEDDLATSFTAFNNSFIHYPDEITRTAYEKYLEVAFDLIESARPNADELEFYVTKVQTDTAPATVTFADIKAMVHTLNLVEAIELDRIGITLNADNDNIDGLLEDTALDERETF